MQMFFPHVFWSISLLEFGVFVSPNWNGARMNDENDFSDAVFVSNSVYSSPFSRETPTICVNKGTMKTMLTSVYRCLSVGAIRCCTVVTKASTGK